MNELTVKVEDLKDVTPISFNEQEIRDYIKDKVDFYNKVEYTDQPITDPKGGLLLPIGDAKKNRAMLNKVVKALKEKRKQIVSERMVPLDKFVSTFKELEESLKAPLTMICSKVLEAEIKIKTQKEANIIKFFHENIGDLENVLTYEKIANDRWLNATYKMKEIEKEIKHRILRTCSDFEVIKKMNSEFEIQIKDSYLNEFNLSDAYNEKAKLDDLKLANKRLKVEQEEKEKASVEVIGEDTINTETGEIIFPVVKKIEEKVHTWKFQITTSISKKEDLKIFMNKNGINYKRI